MMARRSGANPVRRLGCIILLIGLAVVAFVGFRFVHGWTETGPATQDISIVVPAYDYVPPKMVSLILTN